MRRLIIAFEVGDGLCAEVKTMKLELSKERKTSGFVGYLAHVDRCQAEPSYWSPAIGRVEQSQLVPSDQPKSEELRTGGNTVRVGLGGVIARDAVNRSPR